MERVVVVVEVTPEVTVAPLKEEGANALADPRIARRDAKVFMVMDGSLYNDNDNDNDNDGEERFV
jgi:hypothetical protein